MLNNSNNRNGMLITLEGLMVMINKDFGNQIKYLDGCFNKLINDSTGLT
jgi:hypothetical protein